MFKLDTMKINSLLKLAIVLHQATTALSLDLNVAMVEALVKGFNIPSLLVACNNNLIEKVNYYKNAKNSVKFIDSGTNDIKTYENFVRDNILICIQPNSNIQLLVSRLHFRSTMFVVGNETEITDVVRNTTVGVGKKVFFVSVDTGIVTEAYGVGQEKIVNVIGLLKDDKFIRGELDGFLVRRGNFHGQLLVGVTMDQPPLWIFNGREIRARNEDWEITLSGEEFMDITNEPLGGLYYELLNILQKNLNFTAKLVYQKNVQFGSYGAKVNGSWNGLIGMVERKEVDFLAASVSLLEKRFEILDFAWPVSFFTPTFYVPRKHLERREWLAFMYPLKAEVWIFIGINALFLFVLLKLLECYYNRDKDSQDQTQISKTTEALSDFWMVIATYFGRSPDKKLIREEKAIRALLLLTLFFGNFVFICYRSSLTAELAVKRQSLPFTTVEELILSDYR